MICLPNRVWDMYAVEGGGYYFIFQTMDDKWYGLRIWKDQDKQVIIDIFKTKAAKIKTESRISDDAVEIDAEDFRINCFEDGRIGVTGNVHDSDDQLPYD